MSIRADYCESKVKTIAGTYTFLIETLSKQLQNQSLQFEFLIWEERIKNFISSDVLRNKMEDTYAVLKVDIEFRIPTICIPRTAWKRSK